MPLPENLTTRTVVGTFLTPNGNPAKGYIVFTPQVILHNEDTDELILPALTKKNLDSTGSFSVDLIDTDNPDLAPEGWSYYVKYRVNSVPSNDFFTLVPAGNTELNIADLIVIDPSNFSLAIVEEMIADIDALETGKSNTNHTHNINSLVPTQTGNGGKYLQTDGSVVSWQAIEGGA